MVTTLIVVRSVWLSASCDETTRQVFRESGNSIFSGQKTSADCLRIRNNFSLGQSVNCVFSSWKDQSSQTASRWLCLRLTHHQMCLISWVLTPLKRSIDDWSNQFPVQDVSNLRFQSNSSLDTVGKLKESLGSLEDIFGQVSYDVGMLDNGQWTLTCKSPTEMKLGAKVSYLGLHHIFYQKKVSQFQLSCVTGCSFKCWEAKHGGRFCSW